jgi:hypothetical protein
MRYTYLALANQLRHFNFRIQNHVEYPMYLSVKRLGGPPSWTAGVIYPTRPPLFLPAQFARQFEGYIREGQQLSVLAHNDRPPESS